MTALEEEGSEAMEKIKEHVMPSIKKWILYAVAIPLSLIILYFLLRLIQCLRTRNREEARHVYEQMQYPALPIQLPIQAPILPRPNTTNAASQDPPLPAAPAPRPTLPDTRPPGPTQLLCHAGPPSPGLYQNTPPTQQNDQEVSDGAQSTRPRPPSSST